MKDERLNYVGMITPDAGQQVDHAALHDIVLGYPEAEIFALGALALVGSRMQMEAAGNVSGVDELDTRAANNLQGDAFKAYRQGVALSKLILGDPNVQAHLEQVGQGVKPVVDYFKGFVIQQLPQHI